MKSKLVASSMTALVVAFVGVGCEEWMVGAPCKPETDDGTYTPGLKNQTYAIETRSVQCETTMCVTKTAYDPSAVGEQVKYSFCSCRCRDKDGNGYDRNNDKYDDLCECPAGTICSPDVISDNIESVPEKLKGSYCIPDCIENSCSGAGQRCAPSEDSKEPWQWKCKVGN